MLSRIINNFPEFRSPLILALFGLLPIADAEWILQERLSAEIEGVVVSSRNLGTTAYPDIAHIVRGSDGRSRIFSKRFTCEHVPAKMSIGTRIRKLKWRFNYEQDGEPADGDGCYHAVVVELVVGFGFFFSGLFGVLRRAAKQKRMEALLRSKERAEARLRQPEQTGLEP